MFPNPVVAESLLDRIINSAHQVLLDGPSYRPRKRPRATRRLRLDPAAVHRDQARPDEGSHPRAS